jgi:hypothetical protein
MPRSWVTITARRTTMRRPISAPVKPMMSVSNSGATLSIGWKSQPAGTQALVES